MGTSLGALILKELEAMLHSTRCSPASARLAADRAEGCAWLAGGQQVAYWDSTDGQAIRVLDEPCRLTTLAVHPGGQLLAVGGADGIIRLLDYDEGGVAVAPVGVAHCRICVSSVGATCMKCILCSKAWHASLAAAH